MFICVDTDNLVPIKVETLPFIMYCLPDARSYRMYYTGVSGMTLVDCEYPSFNQLLLSNIPDFGDLQVHFISVIIVGL